MHAHGSGLNHHRVIDNSSRKGMHVGQVSTGETEGQVAWPAFMRNMSVFFFLLF